MATTIHLVIHMDGSATIAAVLVMTSGPLASGHDHATFAPFATTTSAKTVAPNEKDRSALSKQQTKYQKVTKKGSDTSRSELDLGQATCLRIVVVSNEFFVMSAPQISAYQALAIGHLYTHPSM